MSSTYLKVLQNYLKEDEWRENVEVFVSANCNNFETIEEYSHGIFPSISNFATILRVGCTVIFDVTPCRTSSVVANLPRSCRANTWLGTRCRWGEHKRSRKGHRRAGCNTCRRYIVNDWSFSCAITSEVIMTDAYLNRILHFNLI